MNLQSLSKKSSSLLLKKNTKSVSPVDNPENAVLHAPFLVLTCMDFRLRNKVQEFMEQRAGKNSYDEIVLPGASLAVTNDNYPHWGKTFEDVLELAIELHGVTTVIIIDHRECGAYRLLKGLDTAGNCDKETDIHREILGKAKIIC